MRERNTLHAEVRIDDQVAGEDLGRHYLTHLSVDHLLPRVRRVGHHEAEVEAVLLDHLVLHRHHLADRKLVH